MYRLFKGVKKGSMKKLSIAYSIIVMLCFIVEIVLIDIKSELAYIPVLISLAAYGIMHFFIDMYEIYKDSNKE